jgi:hypothetical protein
VIISDSLNYEKQASLVSLLRLHHVIYFNCCETNFPNLCLRVNNNQTSVVCRLWYRLLMPKLGTQTLCADEQNVYYGWTRKHTDFLKLAQTLVEIKAMFKLIIVCTTFLVPNDGKMGLGIPNATKISPKRSFKFS